MSFVNWVIDTLASEDVIDLYFILSDLKEVFLSPTELARQSWGDACSTAAAAPHAECYEAYDEIQGSCNPYHAAFSHYQETGVNIYTGDDTPIGATVL